jgi:hypothetical protein
MTSRIQITVTASSITERLVAAVRALRAAESTAPESFDPESLGYGACAQVVTTLCSHLDRNNLIRRADFESSNGEAERAEIMEAELERRGY